MIVWGVVKIASFAGGNASQQPLREHDIEIELRPGATKRRQGPGMSLYFRDPDGRLLEFISYIS
jgi:catechol 2,3-dioxygenase-like lactoylglutathione lyase family enzyme